MMERNASFVRFVGLIAVLVLMLFGATACQTGYGQSPSSQSPSPSTAASGTEAAVEAVIQKANQEQQQAFAQDNPTLMRSTATAAYYAQLVQTDTTLRSSGVTAIKLRSETFGQVIVQASSAQATTTETWQATYTDSSTSVETTMNIYQLVLGTSVWRIKSDTIPHTNIPPSGSTPGATPTPTANPSPTSSPATVGSTSRNWSGYVATGTGFSAVRGTWTVPTVNAAAGGIDATWVGIGGASSNDLVQAGTQSVIDTGVVEYSAWIETLPQASQTVPLTVSAGDSVTVSITMPSPNVWSISIVDATSGGSYTGTVSYTSSESSAEWIEEAPTSGRTVVKLDQFGTVQFSSGSAVENGKAVTCAQAGATPVTMVNPSGVKIATPSPLAAGGSSFSVTRT